METASVFGQFENVELVEWKAYVSDSACICLVPTFLQISMKSQQVNSFVRRVFLGYPMVIAVGSQPLRACHIAIARTVLTNTPSPIFTHRSSLPQQ